MKRKVRKVVERPAKKQAPSARAAAKKKKGTWGGKRVGAGRPRRSDETVAHAARPTHSRQFPVHITLRMADSVPSLRKPRTFAAVRDAFAEGREQDGFRLTHYSVQEKHVYLIVEAVDKAALSRGMQALCIRIARGVNRVAGRNGRLLAERYEAKVLKTVQEVRQAIVDVLRNTQSRGRGNGWDFDSCTSAPEFDGFRAEGKQPVPVVPRETTAEPKYSTLLRNGWRKLGLVSRTEISR